MRVGEYKVLWGKHSSIHDLKRRKEECSDEGLSNITGHAALAVCVAVSYKDAALSRILSCNKGMLNRREGQGHCQNVPLEFRPG